jgi:hypothetical protein
MPGSLEVRVSITKLLLALVIVIVPLSIVGLILAENGTRSLDRSVATDFKTMAQLYSKEVSQSLYDRLTGVAAIASDPSIVHAAAGTPATRTQTAAATSKNSGGGMLDSPASQFLTQRKSLGSEYLAIAVTNADGHTVAASQPGMRPDYSTDSLWQSAYGNGQGSLHVSGIIDDEMAHAYYIDVAAPVLDANSGTAVGVVRAAVNVSDILLRFHEGQIANGARAELVNEDGTVISAPNVDVFSHVRSQGYASLRDAVGTPGPGQQGWLRADFGNGPWLIGYSATNLRQTFPNLNWLVMVSQDEQQASAPVVGLVHFALIMVVLGGLMLTLLCVYYFLHRTEDIGHIEQRPTYSPGQRAATA